MTTLNDQHIAAVMQAYVDAMSGDEVEKILALYADDATVIDPVGSEPHTGKEALRAFYQTAIEAVEGMELDGNVRVRDKWGAVGMKAHPKGAPGMYMETLDVMEFNAQGLVTRMTAYWGDSNFITG